MLFKRKEKIQCPHCGKNIREDAVYCPSCGCVVTDRGRVQIQFKPTEDENQLVTISVDGKSIWSGEAWEFADLQFFEPTVLWIKYSSKVGGVVGGGFCEAYIDPEKSGKWLVSAKPGQWPNLTLEPVDDFVFD